MKKKINWLLGLFGTAVGLVLTVITFFVLGDILSRDSGGQSPDERLGGVYFAFFTMPFYGVAYVIGGFWFFGIRAVGKPTKLIALGLSIFVLPLYIYFDLFFRRSLPGPTLNRIRRLSVPFGASQNTVGRVVILTITFAAKGAKPSMTRPVVILGSVHPSLFLVSCLIKVSEVGQGHCSLGVPLSTGASHALQRGTSW